MPSDEAFDLLETMLDAAFRAGQAILEVYRTDFDVRMKSDRTPVTEADLAAQDVILPIIAPSGIPVVSEESKQSHLDIDDSWDMFWLVDPLDGTKEFLKRNDEFTVNIALVDRIGARLGVVYAPALGEWYWGGRDVGSFSARADRTTQRPPARPTHGRERISPRVRPVNEVIVAVSRSHLDERTRQFVARLRSDISTVSEVPRGSSLKICMVAAGEADLYVRFGTTMLWDTAAGHAVASGAGCNLVRIHDGAELSYAAANLRNPDFAAVAPSAAPLLSLARPD